MSESAVPSGTPDEPAAAWAELRDAVTGEVLLPTDARYERARKPFIARFDDVRPAAVVRCREPADVAAAIRVAAEHGLPVVPRSGGHSFAGFSTTTGVLVDVTPMNDIRYADGLAHVGAGTRIGHLTTALLEQGVAVPGGSCPSVGVAGSALGGGIGVVGRKYGFTSDHLVAADVVLADGSSVRCDADHEADLFWALRGAGGGNFGVVTSLTFSTRPAHDLTSFLIVWPFAAAVDVFAAWQEWIQTVPDELAPALAFTDTEGYGEEPIVEFYGAMIGDTTDADPWLDRMVKAVGSAPVSDLRKTMPYGQTMEFWGGQVELVMDDLDSEAPRQGWRVTKSEYFSQPLPIAGIEALAAAFVEDRYPGQYRGLELAHFGAAYNAVSPDATALVHRDQLFTVKHAIVMDPDASAAQKQAAIDWTHASWSSVRPYGARAVYPNFPDPDLTDWSAEYYGANYPRLREVKGRYDPDNVFRFPHSVELP